MANTLTVLATAEARANRASALEIDPDRWGDRVMLKAYVQALEQSSADVADLSDALREVLAECDRIELRAGCLTIGSEAKIARGLFEATSKVRRTIAKSLGAPAPVAPTRGDPS